MKKNVFLLILLGLFISANGFAQKKDSLVVPARVKNRMIANWPQTQAVPVKWEKEGANYKGTVIIMEKPAVMVIDSTGKIVRIEKRLHETYLPQKIKDQLNKQYPGYAILDLYQLTDDKGKESYRTTFQYKQTILYNSDGTVAGSK